MNAFRPSLIKLALVPLLLFGLTHVGRTEEKAAAEAGEGKPVELGVVKAAIGVWDAKIEVWAAGLEADPIVMTAVETNVAHGEYWLASDFESEFQGETIAVHSIMGYDLDEKRLVGKVIDHGPYAAKMTGDYDEKSKTVTWITHVKDPSGKPIVQKTLVTQKNENERELVLMKEGKGAGEFVKFMQIKYVKRN